MILQIGTLQCSLAKVDLGNALTLVLAIFKYPILIKQKWSNVVPGGGVLMIAIRRSSW